MNNLSIQPNTNVESIETIFFKTTSPIHKSADPNLMNLFCTKVNNEADGHHQAIRLISHKIQSPQEHEALRTLELLEVCVQSCGKRFQQEIGKFRFLNEMIKLVSPKYLANHTSDKVKKKVIEILYSWTIHLPEETKINEAYQMLKKQSIILEDPNIDTLKTNQSSNNQRQKSIFEQDEEKNKILQRLLKSRKPEDLEQANALIKSFVKKDEEKIEKLTNRATELEKAQNNLRLLSEMISQYDYSTIKQEEQDTIEYLHDQLEKFRPILFRLATESEDDDQGLGEILSTSDSLTKVLSDYQRIVQPKQFPTTNDQNKSSQSSTDRTLIDLIQDKTNEKDELEHLFGSISTNDKDQLHNDDCLPLFQLSSSSSSSSTTTTTTAKAEKYSNEKKSCLFDDLQDLLVDVSSGQKIPSTKSSFSKPISQSNSIPLNQLLNNNSIKKDEEMKSFPSIRLESIRPSNKNPSIQFKLKHSTGIHCILHISKDTPRIDIIPLVLTVTNTNTDKSIQRFQFDAKTNKKNIQIKLEKASGEDLPAYNPIFPPSALTQIILLSNPNKENIEIHYEMKYFLSDQEILEDGNINEGIPAYVDLIEH